MMAKKSSANENKENDTVLPSHGKAWKCGRGEVPLARVEISTATFFSFFGMVGIKF
jgi:hypothetical protein